MKGNHENLKNARGMLLEMRQGPGYDSDASESQEAKKHIDLFTTMYTESFDDLNHLNINEMHNSHFVNSKASSLSRYINPISCSAALCLSMFRAGCLNLYRETCLKITPHT